MVFSDDIIHAAVIDSDSHRREHVAAALDRLLINVKVSTGHGIVAHQMVYEAAPHLTLVSFEEPFARSASTVSHAAAVSRVVAYSSDSGVETYRAAIRAGAHNVISAPPSDTDLERALHEALPKRAPAAGQTSGQVIAVTSAKGGTGKSTVAATIARLLARRHSSAVLLVDFALEFGDTALLLDVGTGNSTARAARQVARSEIEEFRESLGYHQSGVFVLGPSQRFSERLPVEPHELEGLLHLASLTFDHIIVDTSAVFDERLMLALNSAGLNLVVSGQDVVSIANTHRFLVALADEGFEPQGQLPMLLSTNELPAVAPVDAADILERPALWEVPYDRSLSQANQLGSDIHAGKRLGAVRSLAALADRIASDPTRIERRDSVRPSKQRYDPAYAERLRRFFAPAPPENVLENRSSTLSAGELVYSTALNVSVYHEPACTLATRINGANRAMVSSESVPAHLRPCRVCLPSAQAA